jgi:hypothetical protein
MATKKSPLGRTKDEHGTKEKLVDKLVSLLGQIQAARKTEEDKDELKARLLAASNKKLNRLFEIGSEIREKYGSVDKLADAAATVLGRAKDAPYVAKLKALSPGKLLDIFQAAEKRGQSKKTKAA